MTHDVHVQWFPTQIFDDSDDFWRFGFTELPKITWRALLIVLFYKAAYKQINAYLLLKITPLIIFQSFITW